MQQAEQSQTGTLAAALAETGALLKTNPAEAERRADRILKDIPGQQQALLLLVSARRAQGDTAGARAMLELAAMTQPRLAAVKPQMQARKAPRVDMMRVSQPVSGIATTSAIR